MNTIRFLIMLILVTMLSRCSPSGRDETPDIFSTENLVAWCIVPFDAAQRTPLQRAEMLNDLGFKKMAYDYRDEHIPFFREEIGVLKEHGIGLAAVWLWVDPRGEEVIAGSNRQVLDILGETGTRTELWVGIPGHLFEGLPDSLQLAKAVSIVSEVRREAAAIGCTIALYNHGGWFGEPENQVRIIEATGEDDIRIVYNFHHGHHQVGRFEELLDLMLPYLSTVNINGMKAGGPKIITLGGGELEAGMLRALKASGYSGPVGILGHTEGEDIRVVLERNLEGLKEIRKQL